MYVTQFLTKQSSYYNRVSVYLLLRHKAAKHNQSINKNTIKLYNIAQKVHGRDHVSVGRDCRGVGATVHALTGGIIFLKF